MGLFILVPIWLPKGGNSLIKTLALECEIEIPDEYFELNPEIDPVEFKENLLDRFEAI
jgi:hypothetical protein